MGGIANARRLLHSLHDEHPLEHSITLAALFRVYNLPPASSDLLSCAMLTSACLKDGKRPSLTIAREMVPHLKGMLTKINPASAKLSGDKLARATLKKEKTWLAWTLKNIEAALSKEEQDLGWLSEWRQESENASVAS